jgi:hypothetical protein
MGFSEAGGGHSIRPPINAPALLRRRVGVCVVGVGAWESLLLSALPPSLPQC